VFSYDCDFNKAVDCLPDVAFQRVDDPHSDSPGFNYRRAVYGEGGATRDLYKWYGMRLTLVASGSGKMFTSIVNAVSNCVVFLVCFFFLHRCRCKRLGRALRCWRWRR
jgi:hypothetical protein